MNWLAVYLTGVVATWLVLVFLNTLTDTKADWRDGVIITLWPVMVPGIVVAIIALRLKGRL